ncbi:hypothetical protein [Microbacterium pumilum]|uniref:Polysaccharide chain length determinant N-terminal domain-containing protein n=1 Tax=Microbacterium pumilum TaxID=344165 RepID=A0ABN2S1L7_9MICO
MTFWELVRAFIRHWPIVLIGAVCTAGAGFVAISDDGVYFTRAEIVFLAPTSSLYPNALRTQSEDLIDTAGIVAKRLAGPGKVTKFASPDVTLIGMGVRDGWSLRLPDTGGQWATNYATQTLNLDVVAATEDEARARQTELVERVKTELNQLQRDANVDPVNDITAIAAPESTVMYHVGGSTARVLGMTAALGIGLTVAAVLFLEYRRQPRRDLAPRWTSRARLRTSTSS